MRRSIAQPVRHVALLVALAALPTLLLVVERDEHTAASVLHVVICFLVLMFAFRLLGKRELSRLSPFELVTLMLIPEILSNTLQGEGSLLQGLSGLCTVLGLVLGTSLLAQRFRAVQGALEAPPSVLVADGVVLEEAMNAERITPDELASEMRKQGICNLQDVRFAVLEGGGNITFIPRGGQPQQRSSGDDEAEP
jgi:uncharacterized membrane protein YcaP (DUF421 family)